MKNGLLKLVLSLITGLILIVGMLGCDSQTVPDTTAPQAATRTITDMAGRTVVIPAVVNTVYCAVPTAESMVYSLAPEKMAAWVFQQSDDALSLLGARAKELPVLGGWMGEKVTANLEEIAKLAPDVIIWLGDPETGVTTAESITQQTQRPVVIMDSDFDPTPESYRLMGEVLGLSERAEELAEYWENAVKEVSDMVAEIPDDEIVKVYYAEGTGGLSTDASGSGHTVIIDFVRGFNVAVGVEIKQGAASSPVSMEQVLSWNPDVILVSSSSGGADNYDTILTDESWSQIKAVQDKRVYVTPNLPFPWFDRPPCVGRALGVYWCANVLYPDYVKINIRDKTREFCKLFYDIDLTEAQLDLLLKNAE